MASLVLGAAGAVVGGFFGGPAGASAGWAIGSAIGGAISSQDKPDITGEKLRDLRVMDSAYGNFITIGYGRFRVSGNVIWAVDLIPVEHVQHSSGKGGGGGQAATTYTYNFSGAIAICKGPIAGIRRIWANGQLIYDVSSGSAATGSPPIAIYLGNETQTADPTISAYVGASNTPAYRGIAYVVFTGFDVSKYGNSPPSFSFEVMTSVVSADSARLIKDFGGTTDIIIGNSNGLASTPNGGLYGVYVAQSGSAQLPNGTYGVQISPSTGALLTPFALNSNAVIVGVLPDGRLWMQGAVTGSDLSLFVPGSWTSTAAVNIYSDFGVQASPTKRHAVLGTNLWCINDLAHHTPGSIIQRVSEDFSVTLEIATLPVANETLVALVTDNTYIYAVGANGLYKYDTGYGALLASNLTADASRVQAMYYNGYVWVSSSGTNHVVLYNVSDLSVAVTITNSSVGSFIREFLVLEDGTVAVTKTSGAVSRLSSTGTILSTSYLPSTPAIRYGVVNTELDATYGYAPSAGKLYQVYSNRSDPGTVTLSSIVADLHAQAGMLSSDYDVTALAATNVDGFFLSSQAPARQWIEQLMATYFFDAVEHNGKVAYIMRGGASAVTIPDDDLAAYNADQGGIPPILTESRQQETELSKSIQVTYYNRDNSYLQTTQQARRLATKSSNQTNLNLNVVVGDDQAIRIAAINLYAEHVGRVTYTFSTSLKYAKYEPTDIVTVDGKVMRITTDNRDTDGVIHFTAVSEDSSIYTNGFAGVAPTFPAQSVTTIPISNALYLDLPQLRDQDTDLGLYFAVYSTPSWSGCVVYKSSDGGITYQSIEPVFVQATVGVTTTALGNYTGPNIPDEANSVTLTLYTGSLSSITYAQMLAGQNLLLIGSELVNARTITQNADSTITSSGLLRGQFGTERAINGHAAGELVVVISAATLSDIQEPSSDINATRLFKAITLSGNITVTPPQSVTNTGVRLKPYAPVQLSVGRNASLDCLINWQRRARYGGAWRDYVDAPIAETVESYDVEIYSSNAYTTLKRTFTANGAPPLTYTAAQQVTDFGSTQSTIYFKVYQNSSVVGRGFAATGQG